MFPENMDQATTSISLSRDHEETGMEHVLSDLQALKKLYGLLHRGPADEHLDETSRALLMSMLDDATQQVLLRQAKMLSGSLTSPALKRKLSIRSDHRVRDAEPRLAVNPRASPSPSLQASERSRRLNLQYSTVSSRDGRHVHGHRHAAGKPPLARLTSYRSSRSAMPPRHSGRSLHHLSIAATSQHGTVTGSSRHAEQRDKPGCSSGRGDQSSLERSSRRRTVYQEPSLGRARLHGHATTRHVGAEGSSSTRRFGRLDSGLSLSMMSRRDSERTGRGMASPGHSSSSNTMVTMRSRIMPNRELTERCLRHAEEEESTPRRRREDGADSSAGWSSSRPRRTLNRIDSGSMYSRSSSSSSVAASSSPSASPTVSPASSTSAASSSPVSWRPVYTSEVSGSLRSRRRRRERQERREGRLRRLKNRIAMVFHHRHDHHHHHHFGRGQEGPSRRDRGAGHRKSPWRYLGGVFHRTKGQDKKTTSRTVVSVPAKGRGGRHMHALFDATVRHLRGTRRAPASVRMRRTGNRVRVNKTHWWQRRRRSRSRRRLGHGKAV